MELEEVIASLSQEIAELEIAIDVLNRMLVSRQALGNGQPAVEARPVPASRDKKPATSQPAKGLRSCIEREERLVKLLAATGPLTKSVILEKAAITAGEWVTLRKSKRIKRTGTGPKNFRYELPEPGTR